MEQQKKTSRSNDPIMQPVSWDTLMRRRSSMSYADLNRRSSLLSVSLFDMPLLPGARNDSEPHEMDPFAPLTVSEGYSVSRKHSLLPVGHHVMNDRSESSVPSLSNSSASNSSSSSYNTAHASPMRLGGMRTRLPSLSHMSPYESFMMSPLSPVKQAIQMNPHRMMSSGPYCPPLKKPQHQPSMHQQFQQPQMAQQSHPQRQALHGGAPPGNVMSHSQTPAPSPDVDEDEEDMNNNRFKPFHEEKWSLRYKELLEFHKEHGHSAVPHTYPKNPQLARWVKRQRRQYKLRRDNRPSTMTAERLEMLQTVGFIWDSHDVNWREKLDSLHTYKKENGHCNVPSNYSDKKLATWVKCQRRQYKLYWDGKPSAMNPDRILELEKIGFEWEIRSTVPRKSPTPQQTAIPRQNALPMSAPSSSMPPPQQDDFNLLYQQGFHTEL